MLYYVIKKTPDPLHDPEAINSDGSTTHDLGAAELYPTKPIAQQIADTFSGQVLPQAHFFPADDDLDLHDEQTDTAY